VDQPHVRTAAVLATTGGGTWNAGNGTTVSRARGRAVLVFDAVTEAVGAARRAAAAGAGVGVAVGELSVGDDWWAGPPIDVAEALAVRAGPRQVLATVAVPALLARDGAAWQPAGVADVAAGGRVDVVELAIAPIDGDGAPGSPGVPLPRLLAIDAPFPFVPRNDVWPALERAWAAGASGGHQVVLLGGDAGTGKTRVVSEFARHVHRRGGVVLHGSCSDRLAAPYQPFSEAVEHLVRSLSAAGRSGPAVKNAGELARLSPALADALGVPPERGADDPDTARYRLFGAVSAMLGSVAERRPLFLVLDDLQWAGQPTVRLLDHLSRDSSLGRVVVVAAYRSGVADVGPALREALPELHRQPAVVRAAVRPFDEAGIRRFVAGAASATARAAGTLDVAGLDIGGLDVAGLDVAGLDVAGLDVAGLDVAGLDIGGLGGTGVGGAVDAAGAGDPDASLAPAVSRTVGRTGPTFATGPRAGGSTLDIVADVMTAQTGGNAFLMGELWRHLVGAGYITPGRSGWRLVRPLDDVGSPEGVREVVESRLAALPVSTRSLIEVAAVAGTRFSSAAVAEAAGVDHRAALAALDPAVRAGLVDEAGPGEHGFAHALVRRSVVDSLGPAARRGHHLDLGRALQRRGGQGSSSEIAHHLTAAVPLVEADEAVAAARRAAAEATAAVAYDDAARHVEAVLPLVGSGRLRCELLLEIAEARMRAGDVAGALDRCLECGAAAGAIDEPDLVVAAALSYDDANWRAALHGGVAEKLLRRALPLAPDAVATVRVQAALARSLAFTGRGDEARDLADEALAAAREVGDFEAIRVAMTSVLFAPWTSDTIDHQVAIARELLEQAAGAGDLEWETGALSKLLYGLITLGELDEVRLVARRFADLTERSGQPLYGVLAHQAKAVLAMGEGRFADAEALADEANALTTFLSGTDAEGGYGVQLFSIRREQGRLDEARPLVEAVVRLGQEGQTWRPALAVLYAELGRLDDAARELHHLIADDLGAVPRDALWCGALSYLADAAVAIGDRAAAEVLYRELLPFRRLVVQVGNHLAAYGAADRYLGALAALGGRARDAETHFEAALRLDERARMPVWVAHTQLAYGRFLAGRGRVDDQARARQLLSAAAGTARSLGLARVAPAAEAVLGRTALRSVASPGPTAHAATAATLTARELGVLRLLVDGRSNREIGERLNISQHTAANHVRSILLKTGCANRTEAASWAVRRGVVAD
jgi:DNA-binding CsgD family transcriptional regulator/tetratricopeptide (TPR) repeat protein